MSGDENGRRAGVFPASPHLRMFLCSSQTDTVSVTHPLVRYSTFEVSSKNAAMASKEISSSLSLCNGTSEENWRVLVWQNMSPENFISAYFTLIEFGRKDNE